MTASKSRTVTAHEIFNNIPKEYKENVIQRGIVKNVYLDRLVKTIINQDCIPSIILVGDNIEVLDAGKQILLKDYRILDGLQRTYRIHEIWKALELFETLDDKDQYIEMTKMKIAKALTEKLKEHECDINVFLEVINEYKISGNIDRFKRYFYDSVQWFEVWEGLSSEQETAKMLVLNAGHRQMDIRHQLELLFLNVLPKLNDICVKNGGKGILRNKEVSDMVYSKNRVRGEFYFSHIISAIISYCQRKPVTTNTDLVNRVQGDNEYYEDDFKYEKLESYMNFLIELDKKLEEIYKDFGVRWIARETTLVALFAAIGEYEDKYKKSGFDEVLNKVTQLNIDEFESARQKNIEISKVNVGNVTKNAVKDAISDLLEEKVPIINWNTYFGGNENAEN